MMNADRKPGPEIIGGPKLVNPSDTGEQQVKPGPEIIGGPKLVGSDNTGKKKVPLKAGTEQNIVLFNDNPEQLNWKMAQPAVLPGWLKISPVKGTLTAKGTTGANQTIKVSVTLPIGGAAPATESVKFEWDPLVNGQTTGYTLVVTVTR